MRKYGIEPDHSDFRIGPYRVDFYFRRERVAVEVDGFRYHATPARFAADRRRAAALGARGVQIFPLTWDDVTVDSEVAIRRLKATLLRRSEG